uniref:Uncharacterized protein n=1 Tax=Oryctolagus cuniculus TaxID=9986 RepID=A0A5F9CAZ6_RABIT
MPLFFSKPGFLYIHTYIYMYACMCLCVCADTHIYIHTYIICMYLFENYRQRGRSSIYWFTLQILLRIGQVIKASSLMFS